MSLQLVRVLVICLLREILVGGRMLLRNWILLSAGLILSGCAGTSGIDYAGMLQKVGPPSAGQSRIVVLEEKTNPLGATACDVKLDGSSIGKLKRGTYVYADRPAGRHQLLATETMFPGESTRNITTVAGRTYFILARTSERHNAVTGMTVLGGLGGAAVASAATANSLNPGPIDFLDLDEVSAKATLGELELAE
jgi:Protein of unknown function (DUF2846)